TSASRPAGSRSSARVKNRRSVPTRTSPAGSRTGAGTSLLLRSSFRQERLDRQEGQDAKAFFPSCLSGPSRSPSCQDLPQFFLADSVFGGFLPLDQQHGNLQAVAIFELLA